MGDDLNSQHLDDNLQDHSRANTGASTTITSPQEQAGDLAMQKLLSHFTNHYEDDEDKKEDESRNAATPSAPNAFMATSFSLTPGPDDEKAIHKICSRPRCPHNKIPLHLAKFQETNRRGEVIVWKHCRDCRTKHAKEDRERKQAIRAKARTRAHDDKKDDRMVKHEKRNRLTKLVTLRAHSDALKVLATGGNIAADELTETFAEEPILVLRDGFRDFGKRRRLPSALRKRPRKDDGSSDGEWGSKQVQKRRKSNQKGKSSNAKKEARVGKAETFEKELGPEDSVYDTGTNSEEERDKKSGERSVRRG